MSQTQTETTQPDRNLASFLAEPLRVGNPDVLGPLAVFPLFAPEPQLEYLAFAQARELGFRVGELEGRASVNDLLVENPAAGDVLLFEGEEVLGAQQNRTIDISVLVAAGAKVRVPVSCVEAGRWQQSRHVEDFSPAPQTAYPELRRAKAQRVRERVAIGLEARADQREVWDEIAVRSDRLGTDSPTGAMHDVYEQRRDRLAEMHEAIRLRQGQAGALVAIGGRFAVLDLVGRPDVFAALYSPLVQGYALDALTTQTGGEATPEPPEEDTARGFALLVTDCRPAQRRPGISLGEELRFEANGVAGSALVHDGELVQLTAFPADGRATSNRGP